ncbi:hypothetical protein, partial [Salinivibrio sp. IB872]|uniref:hypothetical protein n=1 Tax=Salinivibrio sp. IB872 TaxID=1766123 RepID=UPI0009CD3DF8
MGYKLNKSVKLSKIAEKLGCEWQGRDIEVKGVASFDNLCPTDIAFTNELTSSVAGSAVITQTIDISFPEEMGIIVADN